jgi:Rrf2 family nitric oxide-sensitive transcriptional repressor
MRGQQGGLELVRLSDAINLGDLLRCCEDDLALVECFRPATNHCRNAPACALTGIAQDALDAFLRALDRYTLADLAALKSWLLRALEEALTIF